MSGVVVLPGPELIEGLSTLLADRSRDDDLTHIVCDCGAVLCGAEPTDEPVCAWDCTCPLHELECVVCADLEEFECERCGA